MIISVHMTLNPMLSKCICMSCCAHSIHLRFPPCFYLDDLETFCSIAGPTYRHRRQWHCVRSHQLCQGFRRGDMEGCEHDSTYS